MNSFSTFGEFIQWLATGPGLVVAMSFIESYILQRFPFWASLDKSIKAVTVMVLAGLFAWGMSFLSGLTVLVNDQTLNIIYTGVIFYVGSQVAYRRYFKTV